MNRVQAEIKAGVFNRMVPVGRETRYGAHPIENTRWEKDRWCVAQYRGSDPVAVGIAAV